ncbi:hypothetical protein CPR19092_LGOLGGFK_00217 [Companilactobacillus paralimentarius]|uniref:hypothetical protein n=1 Tax=Companilactobacillus paralimentarius TaxID=83526 RepID=UPI00384B2635
MRKNFFKILFLIVSLGLAIRGGEIVVQAGTSQQDAMQEARDGLAMAPDNLGLNETQFSYGDFSGFGSSARNSAILQNSSMHSTGTSYDPLMAIRMTNYINQEGAIWSNVDNGNYVNINNKQTLSCWLYFGPSQHIHSGDSFGDGMAFVLQNPANGISSFSHNGTTIGTGETLGVWGMDTDKSIDSIQKIADTAIQDSWALEFDTNANKSKVSNDDFDDESDITGQHIAYGYPGDASTYVKHSADFIGSSNYYSMNHSGVRNITTLHDGNWHHLTVSWDPTTFRITYKYNDKNLDGSKSDTPLISTSDPVHATEFGGKSAMTNKLQWGFTATSGSAYEPNLIALESIPSSVEGTVTSDITDNTQNRTFSETDTNRNVNSGDSLSFNYHLRFDSGENKWLNDVAQITFPSNVTFKNGDANQVLGYVTYNDGSDAKAEPIYASEIDQDTGRLKHSIAKDLYVSSDGTYRPSEATITVNGVANDVTSTTKVDSVSAHFDSDNLITDTDTPDFTIKKAKAIGLTLDQSNLTVDNSHDANITGTVSYVDGSTVNNSDITVHENLNGKDKDLATSKLDSSAASGKLNLNIPSADLTQTTNTLKVYVEDADGNVSTTSTVVITKKGSLSLKVDDYSFGTINQATASMLIPRKGDWNIVVNDGRENGTTNPWHLSATTSGLYNGDTAFNGNLVFKNSSGSEQSLTGSTGVNIANGYKSADGNQVTNVGKSWNDSDGILLKTTGFNSAGQYTGKMNWVLSERKLQEQVSHLSKK